MQDKIYDVVIIGAGPSGLMAAIRAAERGKRVVVFEKNNIIGAKLLLSGKGRCNLTNMAELGEFIDNFGKNGKFLYNVFQQFFNYDLMNFFESRGLRLSVERGGRVFPEANNAYTILNILKKCIDKLDVYVALNNKLEQVIVKDKTAVGVKTSQNRIIKSNAVILSTGGLSYPKTGSTGDGYRIAKVLGHNIITPLPALVPLRIKELLCNRWQGISLKNVSVAVFCNEKKIISDSGDLIFTHFGISGPVILSISNAVSELLHQHRKPIALSINLKNNISKEELDNRLIRIFAKFDTKLFKNVLKEILPKGIIEEFINLLDISSNKIVNQITKEERLRVIKLLTDLRLTVTNTRPIEEAIITRGGIDTSEINPKTMESRLIKGLYFAGEVIDIDAKTGGFNLQAAFSTGYVAGNSC